MDAKKPKIETEINMTTEELYHLSQLSREEAKIFEGKKESEIYLKLRGVREKGEKVEGDNRWKAGLEPEEEARLERKKLYDEQVTKI